ncbi:hypothetical protein [Campylobacter cuniculorum]|uniref:Uncharacterized protein n=1 Tax=Campylobacter cuniculorum TaxID=374106 RepID=A0ABX6TZE8_9BACT|nr:hypothetical protein [Campylobacter cuniculorum]QOR05146.1 hypothetical protein A0071_04235 [Campylobacter cuniculorum]
MQKCRAVLFNWGQTQKYFLNFCLFSLKNAFKDYFYLQKKPMKKQSQKLLKIKRKKRLKKS